jgi:hypothetical protein
MKRFWIFGGALVVTLGALVLPMLLGSAVFNYSRFSDHEGRLRRVMRHLPTAELLDQAFRDEGTTLLAAPATSRETRQLADEYGGDKAAEIRGKAERHPHTRVYRAGDMLYFVYFDEAGVMRDFTCVSR